MTDVSTWFARARAESEAIEGWLTEAEASFLFETARTTRHAIVEIGSYKGKSTVSLALGALAGCRAPVWAIDPHTGNAEHQAFIGEGTLAEFKRNLERSGAADSVKTLVATSEKAARDWREPIGFLFVDGSHAYKDVKLDLQLWLPHVVEGGIVAVHDSGSRPGVYWATGWPGPVRATREDILFGRGFSAAWLVDTILVAQRAQTQRIPRARALTIEAQRQALRLQHYAIHDIGERTRVKLRSVLPKWARVAGKRVFQAVVR
jgi:predicted O-methyltransferase YrrM